jgi:protein involved in polysaccharide export with SLBB domain
MRKRNFLLFALLAFPGYLALYSQSVTGSDSFGVQQNQSADCIDAASALSGGCAQNQERSQQQILGGTTGTESQSSRFASPMVSSPSENATLGGRTGVRSQEPPLPPDAPTEFQKFVAATTGQLLPIYGANLFRNVPSTFSPNDLAPVTSGYVIGPDDELRVRIWGQISYSGNLRVDRSGNIYLPQAGEVHVAGLPFSALDQHLRAAVARMYRNFDLSVDIGRIRSMQVYVTGQARRPGVYTVSSLSTLVDTLFASGGPSPHGSLRHILLKRDGKTIADFDLYALLIYGDKSKDLQLLPEDVLYIPAAGPEVAVTGSVRNPGIYEQRGSETIGDLLEAAGKTTALSSSARISLERVEKGNLRQAMEFDSDAKGLAVPVADGDILRINSLIPAYRNTVTLRGNVANPGRFSLRPGMHLSDLIPDRESLVSRDYWWKRSHLGLPVPEFESTISTLGQDQRTPESNLRGAFTAAVTQETLTEALTAVPNPARGTDNQQDSADTSHEGASASLASRLTRTTVPGTERQTKQSKLNEVRLSSPEINWNYAVIERLDPETLKTSLIPFDLGKLVLNHDASQNLGLQAGDTVTIFSQADIRVPLEEQTKYVNLEGEFVHAGIYSVQPGETLRDLVRRAGGLTNKAYLYGSEFTRESTRFLQQQRIDEYVKSVNMEAQRGLQALSVSTTSSGGAAEAAASRTATQDLIARLSQIKATGRIVLQFRPDNSNLEDVPPITLENGDQFIVPFAPATVNVVGAVYNQNSFLYQPSHTAGSYLQMAGGPNRSADSRRTFVIRADGSVISRDAVKGVWGNEFKKQRLNPGDTIVVPDKTLRPNALRGVLDWTQIFSQLALGAAAINVL